MATRVLVLGHSFVRRLWFDIFNGIDPDLIPNLGIQNASVRFLGFSGGNINTLLRDNQGRLHTELSNCSPEIVVLQIGGNYVDCLNFNKDSYMEGVRELISYLVDVYGVNKVVVCEIFPRFKFREVDFDTYLDLKDQINFGFFVEFFHSPHVCFWRHREGLMSNHNVFHDDGVHLNLQGTKKFFRSLRGAVLNVM